ncbi:MAG: hypothetical protein MUF37_03245 [Methanoregulaceae archaeon]|nr:hypothetical protein [Methanoregulaceae archaeon]
MKKVIKHLLLLASSIIFGTQAIIAEDPVRDRTGPMVSGNFDRNDCQRSAANSRDRFPHVMVAANHTNQKEIPMVVVSACETRTLAWNPGLHRYYCAEWWMEAHTIRDAPDSIAIQMEYIRTRARMGSRGTREGFPLRQVNIRVTGSDTHRFDAISGLSRSTGTVPTSYRYSTGIERINCQEFAIATISASLPSCTSPPAGPDNDGLVENESDSISKIKEELVFRIS